MMASETLTIRFAEGQCEEGCGEETAKGRRFKQGHDARLRSKLYGAARSDSPVVVNGNKTTAAAAIEAHGWPQPAERKPRKAKATEAKAEATEAAESGAKPASTRKRAPRKPKAA